MPTNLYWLGTTTAFATGTNWSPTGPPVSGDSVVFDGQATGPLAASDQSAILLAVLKILSTNTRLIGDLSTPLQIGATSWRIGDPSGSDTPGSGSGRINLNFGTNQFNGVVVNTGTSQDTGREPVRVKGVHASNVLSVVAGRVGVATNSISDVATLATINNMGGIVNVGAGVTLTNLIQTDGNGGGTTTLNCAATLVNITGGSLFTAGSGAITTMKVGNSTASLESTGTITTLSVFEGGTADFTRSRMARTVTTLNLYRGSRLKYNPAVLTITNPIVLVGCSLSDVTIDIPDGATVAIVST